MTHYGNFDRLCQNLESPDSCGIKGECYRYGFGARHNHGDKITGNYLETIPFQLRMTDVYKI